MPDRPIALITGGAKRIGKAICEDLAAHDFDVIVHANNAIESAQELAETLCGHGVNARALQADISDVTAARQLMRDAGRVDVLVNNASIFEPDDITALDDEIWAKHFAVHLHSPSAMVEIMAAQRSTGQQGLVVNIIDQRVWRLTPNFYSYTLSKSALWTATQTMAQALSPHIRINAIGPGPTLPNSRQDIADFEKQRAALPLGYGPELSEFGKTIRYLWSAKSVTGQMIALDGGQHLAWETPDVAGIKE